MYVRNVSQPRESRKKEWDCESARVLEPERERETSRSSLRESHMLHLHREATQNPFTQHYCILLYYLFKLAI